MSISSPVFHCLTAAAFAASAVLAPRATLSVCLPVLVPFRLCGAIQEPLAPIDLVPSALRGGPYPVGFRHDVIRDRSREYHLGAGQPAEPAGRPIALSLWYPAQRPAAALRMTLGEYVALADAPVTVPDRGRQQFASRLNVTAQAAALGALLEARLQAAPGARPSGKFPLVLFAHASPAGQAIMAEFLASQGFVVAGITSRDEAVGPYKLSIANIAAMGTDLQFVIDTLRHETFVDVRRPAVIGMSNGALGAVALESRRGDLAAVVSLDGSIGERLAGQAVPLLLNAKSHPLRSPLLHFYTPENGFLDLTELKSEPRAACQLAELAGMGHTDFLADALYRVALRPDDPAAQHAGARFVWICQRTLEFLRQSLNQPAPASAESPAIEGVRVQACHG